jgi:endonuclease YncB( thermonuclease family)
VGKVLSDGKNINLEQIRNGAAKHNVFDADEQPMADREFYAATETEAKTTGTGLWAGIGYAPEATVPDKSTAAEPAPAVSVKSEKVVERTSPDISPETAEKEKKAEKERVNARAKESETKSEQPLKAGNKSVAAGATARCLDGTYSFRKTRSGSCAYHGGDAEWLNEAKVPKKKAAANSTTHKYILGPRGGCYFINASGNRTYVDRSLCK